MFGFQDRADAEAFVEDAGIGVRPESRIAQELQAAGIAPAEALAVRIIGPEPDTQTVDDCQECGFSCTGACDDDELDVGTCQSCGTYWDARYYERCPSPCGGYIG